MYNFKNKKKKLFSFEINIKNVKSYSLFLFLILYYYYSIFKKKKKFYFFFIVRIYTLHIQINK